MKLKDGFISYESDGEHIMVGGGDASFPGLIRSNDAAAFIVECLGHETTESAIVDAMFEKYDAPRETLAADVRRILDTLRSVNALEE